MEVPRNPLLDIRFVGKQEALQVKFGQSKASAEHGYSTAVVGYPNCLTHTLSEKSTKTTNRTCPAFGSCGHADLRQVQ